MVKALGGQCSMVWHRDLKTPATLGNPQRALFLVLLLGGSLGAGCVAPELPELTIPVPAHGFDWTYVTPAGELRIRHIAEGSFPDPSGHMVPVQFVFMVGNGTFRPFEQIIVTTDDFRFMFAGTAGCVALVLACEIADGFGWGWFPILEPWLGGASLLWGQTAPLGSGVFSVAAPDGAWDVQRSAEDEFEVLRGDRPAGWWVTPSRPAQYLDGQAAPVVAAGDWNLVHQTVHQEVVSLHAEQELVMPEPVPVHSWRPPVESNAYAVFPLDEAVSRLPALADSEVPIVIATYTQENANSGEVVRWDSWRIAWVDDQDHALDAQVSRRFVRAHEDLDCYSTSAIRDDGEVGALPARPSSLMTLDGFWGWAGRFHGDPRKVLVGLDGVTETDVYQVGFGPNATEGGLATVFARTATLYAIAGPADYLQKWGLPDPTSVPVGTSFPEHWFELKSNESMVSFAHLEPRFAIGFQGPTEDAHCMII